jgi:hypothetical protein
VCSIPTLTLFGVAVACLIQSACGRISLALGLVHPGP